MRIVKVIKMPRHPR